MRASIVLVLLLATISGLFATLADHGAAAPSVDLSIKGIEVTQGVQCFDQSAGYTACPDNSLELVSGRPIAVRVYIVHTGGQCPGVDPFSAVVSQASVTIRWVASHAGELGTGAAALPSEATSTFDVPCTTKVTELREDLNGSANFLISPDQLGNPNKAQSLWMEAEVSAPWLNETDVSNNLSSVTLGGTNPGGILPQLPLKVDWTVVYYRPNQSDLFPPISGYSPWPDESNIGPEVASRIQAMYPMSVTYERVLKFVAYGLNPQTGQLCASCPDVRTYVGSESLFCSGDTLMNHLMSAKREISPDSDALMGWLPDWANDGTGFYGAGTNCEHVAWCVDESVGRNQLCLAHEIGHTRGLKHTAGDACAPSTKILETGVDMSALAFQLYGSRVSTALTILPQVIYPGTTLDFMNADPPVESWISPYTWNRLLQKDYSMEWSNQEGGYYCEK